MIGRNLMFHVSDFFAAWPRRPIRRIKPGRSIALRDLARHRDVPLGMVQSTGFSASTGNISVFLNMLVDRSRWKSLRLLKPFIKIPARIGALIFGKATVFATILEDHAYAENRVMPDPQDPTRIHFEYVVRPELRRRIKLMRLLYRRAFRRHRLMILNSEVNLNFGHACGTCRFGLDPTTAVLDENNRCHDLSNLYVVDASCFPTSGGANPSLTIAANALRVADHIINRLTENSLKASIAADLL
jgi:choline dehydrogenase-like flavoprotein